MNSADISFFDTENVDNNELQQTAIDNQENETVYTEVATDYSELLQTIVENQDKEIELLTEQKALLIEEINGFSIVSNYLHSFVGIFVVSAVVAVLWNILNKWFFRGV